ncbi:poly(A) polymerase/tRNA nucleotidyltransferase (CCA-adding enzyme) [Nitratireductor aquibiodomus]|uniref:Poly(A) polymerase/tRNA nucleotidyltransferase (CCA-adding enzyme) n=1 Tax=Nitratireductor aquibiodomus TaxID=204799 RepID=A0A1H4J8G5_9HYPH|nr:CCA tRNA nucleotidyltransferase [Nitratireductor aquibiodomus]SEB42604.1 poly(A) polymerase/tRNA nucleotidyltransferase (CCA-adding enzyme) [Nitratireductor aquibiodomus]
MDKRLISDSKWLADEKLQTLLAALSTDGEEARIVGGAVRNTLLGQTVTDIDIATTTEPGETVRRARSAGFRTAPTGIDHGTVTVIADGRAWEVTTLRADVETDGRHASVTFGRDWRSDAERRDFTINALYACADGEIVDLVGGLPDLENRTLRFIGDADTRITEDYLRILRFFRFFAWYGRGRPDAAGLKACARHRDGLERLSAERVWAELKKLLSAPDPSRALLWMRQTGVLTKILPESEKWGIDTIGPLIEAEQTLGWQPDPLLRLAAIIPPYEPRITELGRRLRLSNAEKAALEGWAEAPSPAANLDESGFRKIVYRADAKGLSRRLKLALVSARARASEDDGALMEAAGYTRLMKLADAWQKPSFPVNGNDLAKLGLVKGKAVGEVLARLEEEWIASDFSLKRDALLERAAAMISSAG